MPKIRAGNIEEHNRAIWRDLAAALEKLLSERPYESVTIADIAAETGLARNTMYNYARDKSALLGTLTATQAQVLHDQVMAICQSFDAPDMKLTRILEAIMNWFGSAEHRHLIHCALFGLAANSDRTVASAPLKAISGAVETVLEEGVKANRFRPIHDIPFTTEMMAKATEAAAFRVVRRPEALADTSRELREFISNALTHRD